MQKIGPGFLIAERYQFVELIGEGGMGKVYLAEDLLLSRRVAIKTVHPEMSNTSEIAQRIDRECRLHARLGVQPNIVALHDRLVEDGRIFLIMEYIDGGTLENLFQVCNEKEPVLSPEQGGDIVNQVLAGLQCIHNHGMVHNDVKPANILLHKLADGSYLAKLMDFGIAVLPGSDAVGTHQLKDPLEGGPGTPTYMAPECIDPDTFGEVGACSDLYAAGVILYQFLAGRPPFTGSMAEIFTGHIKQHPDFASLESKVSPQYLEVLAKILQKKQEDRYQSASAFTSALTGAGPFGKALGENTIHLDNEAQTEKTLPITHPPKSALQPVIPKGVTGSGLLARLLADPKKMGMTAGILVITVIGGVSWFLGQEQATKDSANRADRNVENISASAPLFGEGSKDSGHITEYRLSPPVTSAEPRQEAGEEFEYQVDSSEPEDSLKVFQAARQEKLSQLTGKDHVAENAERGASPAMVPEDSATGSDWKVIQKYSRRIGP